MARVFIPPLIQAICLRDYPPTPIKPEPEANTDPDLPLPLTKERKNLPIAYGNETFCRIAIMPVEKSLQYVREILTHFI